MNENEKKSQTNESDSQSAHLEDAGHFSDTPGVKRKEKKIVIAILIAMAVIVLISIPVLISGISSPDNTSETTLLIYFSEPNWGEDIFDDPEYLGKDRLVWVKHDGTITRGIDISSESDRSNEGAAVNFMFDFIEAQIMGDAESYNACFSEEYLSKHGMQDAFTMQKIYDISLEQYGNRITLDGGGYRHVFILSYKILENNGTLRTDMGSMCERPLNIEVIEGSDGTFKINQMIIR